MPYNRNYTLSCQEVCGMHRPCGNKYCSANPKYVPPSPKKKARPKKSKTTR